MDPGGIAQRPSGDVIGSGGAHPIGDLEVIAIQVHRAAALGESARAPGDANADLPGRNIARTDRRRARAAGVATHNERTRRRQRTARHREPARASTRANADFARTADRPRIRQSPVAPSIADDDFARPTAERAAAGKDHRAHAATLADVNVAGPETKEAVAHDVHRAGPTAKGESRTDTHLDIVRRQVHDGRARRADPIAHIEHPRARIDTHPEPTHRGASAHDQRAALNIQQAVPARGAANLCAHGETDRRTRIEGAGTFDREDTRAIHRTSAFADAHFLTQHRLRESAAINQHHVAIGDRKTAGPSQARRR